MPLDVNKVNLLEMVYSSLGSNNYINFYSSFSGIEELIDFLLRRGRSQVSIYKKNFSGSKEVIVVTACSSVNDKITREFVDGMGAFPMIVAESGGELFNFSVSMNAAIKEALSYSPKYVIISNNDLTPLANSELLLQEIRNKGNFRFGIPRVMVDGKHISSIQSVFHENRMMQVLPYFFRYFTPSYFLYINLRYSLKQIPFYNEHFITKYYIVRNGTMAYKISNAFAPILGKKIIDICNLQPISIVESSLLEQEIFDETFVNGGEDTDLSIRFAIRNVKPVFLEFPFRNIGGASLGNDEGRLYRNTIPEILILGHKMKSVYGFIEPPP